MLWLLAVVMPPPLAASRDFVEHTERQRTLSPALGARVFTCTAICTPTSAPIITIQTLFEMVQIRAGSSLLSRDAAQKISILGTSCSKLIQSSRPTKKHKHHEHMPRWHNLHSITQRIHSTCRADHKRLKSATSSAPTTVQTFRTIASKCWSSQKDHLALSRIAAYTVE